MKVYLEDHFGPLVMENVTKIEFVTKEWDLWGYQTRFLIYVNHEVYDEDGRHLDDFIKIEQEG